MLTNAENVSIDMDYGEAGQLIGRGVNYSDDYSFRLKNTDIKIPKGSLTFIIGRVASGKSSLLYSLLGEMSHNSSPE